MEEQRNSLEEKLTEMLQDVTLPNIQNVDQQCIYRVPTFSVLWSAGSFVVEDVVFLQIQFQELVPELDLLANSGALGILKKVLWLNGGKKLVIGTNYFTDPMGNVMNLEFEDNLISKGIFRVPYDFEDFYELDDLHYICNSYIAKEDLVWSRFLSSFRVKLCPTESMICLDAYFHLFWEKKLIYGEEMQFIDSCYKTFKFKFDVKANGTTVFRGGIGKMFKLFPLEGMEIDYNINGASCSGSGNVGSDVADPGADYSLVKCLTDYDVGASSLVLLCLRRSIFYQMTMETTRNVQLDGLQDQNLNVIWVPNGRDLSVKITYALETLSSWKFRKMTTKQ
ncbi:hypothetical protein DEO72_LG5g2214 [Vigna unguiculata]|uniref:Uncharacterized protein n=1 Tax=Vigna unguiculata TaxID=3917 RepID=A0A4D6LZD2_VIGUN|nr:hypothetical protein DEO72_LG5g2214 [Vigna unguiculata]